MPVSEPAGGGERMLALPLARVTAHKHERQRAVEPLDRTRVRGDQKRESLDRRVAADIDEDRSAGTEGREVVVAVADAAWTAALVPTLWLLDQPAPPEREPLLADERARREPLEVDPARQAPKPPRVEPQEQGRLELRTRRHDEERALLCPATQSCRPTRGVPPARPRTRLDRPQQRQLSTVQLTEHRHRGERTRSCLVRGRQVMEVQQIGIPGTSASEHADPGPDEPLEGSIIDGSKDAVRRPRPVLVGGRERHGRGERIRQLECGRIVERLDVDPREEAARARQLPRAPKRAGSEARLPASPRQRSRKFPRDLRRSAARKEKQPRNDAPSRRRTAGFAVTPPPPLAFFPYHRKPPNSARPRHRSLLEPPGRQHLPRPGRSRAPRRPRRWRSQSASRGDSNRAHRQRRSLSLSDALAGVMQASGAGRILREPELWHPTLVRRAEFALSSIRCR